MTETSPAAAMPVADPADPAVPAKRPGVIRKSAVIALVVMSVIGVLLFPLVVEPWIVGKVKSTLAGQGMELSEDSELSVSLFGGAVTGKDLKIRETGKPATIFTAATLNADVALMDSLSSGDVVIDHLVIEGLAGSLRRTDGHIPGTPPEEPGKPTDWLGLGKQLLEYYKKYAPQDEQCLAAKFRARHLVPRGKMVIYSSYPVLTFSSPLLLLRFCLLLFEAN